MTSLSYAQQRLWFLEQLEPGGAAYNIPAAVRLKGPLCVQALQRSLDEVILRHEVLRTRFLSRQGEPVQEVMAPWQVQLQARPVQAGRLQQVLQACAAQGFDLGSGRLLRCELLREQEQSHVLVLVIHHIVSDGWSMGVLVSELAALYRAFEAGEASPLPPLQLQYGDYAVWQRQWLQGERLQRQLQYWKEQLHGAPALLELPTDRPRPAVQSTRGAQHVFELDEPLTQGLKALGRAQGATLFMVLAAAFNVLLYRYSGQRDLCIGYPIANRHRPEIEGLIGFFVNTLVLRTRVRGDQDFQSLLQQVKRSALDAQAHQDLPFEQLVEALSPARDLARTPLFQVM
uniref:condensation domain-containing protein n=1 Tax=Rubrivivax gelatinosus TaxID=28068 RepID=UPI0005C20B0C